MSLFDGKPLNEKDTPVFRSATVEKVVERGDHTCKHEWMQGTAGTRFCIYCHRRVRVEEA